MPQSTKDERDKKGLFALFKGESGSGKSVAALSFPKPYILDHDTKMSSIARKHFPDKEFEWDTFDDIFKISARLVELLNYCPYETLIGDTVTSLSYTALTSIDMVKGSNVIDKLQNVLKTKGGKEMIELRGFDYYNGEDSFLKYYVDILKRLWAKPGNPRHVILIAHVLASESKNMKTGMITKTRQIVTAGNKIAAYIPAQFDDMYHFAYQTSGLGLDTSSDHVCITAGIGDDAAKCSYNFPEKIEFTNKNFFNIISNYTDFKFPISDSVEIETIVYKPEVVL